MTYNITNMNLGIRNYSLFGVIPTFIGDTAYILRNIIFND
ncbi:hypothetical protein YN1HA_2600 [Sulfurisphaera ohwakuensis]